MKQRIIFYLSISLATSAWAQQSQQGGATTSLSVQQALDLGLKNRYDVQANQYNVLTAEGKVKENKQEWIPKIEGTGNIRYSPQIQSTYIPGGFLPSADASLVALGAKSVSIFGLDLNQTVFNPAISSDIKLAKNNLELEREKVRAQENNVRQRIAVAYFNAILKGLQSDIAADNEQRNGEYQQVAEAKMKAGALIENDWLKAKLDYENAKAEAIKSKQNYELAVQNVKYQVNVPAETNLVLTDSISSRLFDQLPAGDGEGAAKRTEIKQLNLQQQGNMLQVKKYKYNALPTVSLYANYSKQFTYTNLDYSLGQWWSPFSYVGLRINVPITSNFKNATSIREREYITTQTDLTLKQKTADIDYEIRKTSTELSDATRNMQTAKNNYELSQVIYQNQKKQYDLGSLLYSALLDTDKSLRTTEQNYIETVYNYLLANINYQIAIGNF